MVTPETPNTPGKEVHNWIAIQLHFLVLTDQTSGDIGDRRLAPWSGFKFVTVIAHFMQSEPSLFESKGLFYSDFYCKMLI